jgi:hypothetical protein
MRSGGSSRRASRMVRHLPRSRGVTISAPTSSLPGADSSACSNGSGVQGSCAGLETTGAARYCLRARATPWRIAAHRPRADHRAVALTLNRFENFFSRLISVGSQISCRILVRRRSPLPRLARRVTGIAGGFALDFQGDFLSCLLGFHRNLSGRLLDGVADRFLLQARDFSCAGCLAGFPRLAGRQSGGLLFQDGRIIRSRPCPKFLKHCLLGLRTHAQPLVEIIAILEPTHQISSHSL